MITQMLLNRWNSPWLPLRCSFSILYQVAVVFSWAGGMCCLQTAVACSNVIIASGCPAHAWNTSLLLSAQRCVDSRSDVVSTQQLVSCSRQVKTGVVLGVLCEVYKCCARYSGLIEGGGEGEREALPDEDNGQCLCGGEGGAGVVDGTGLLC